MFYSNIFIKTYNVVWSRCLSLEITFINTKFLDR